MARDDEWQQLAKELKRAGQGLAVWVADRAEEHAERARENQEKRRDRKRRERAERRAEQQAQAEERLARTSPLEGWALAIAALACVILAVANRSDLWWLVFVALGLGMRGARILGFHQRREAVAGARRDAEAAARRLAADPVEARIHERCDRLLAVVKESPESVRAFLTRPEETIETLRKTCLDLRARERALRSLVDPQQLAGLERERLGLAARVELETDPVIRDRLGGALAALEQQRDQHALLVRNANRLEAEQTRLGYTLDGLHAQIVRVQVAGGGEGATDGLRQSIETLRAEVGTLADALDEVNADVGGARARVRG